MRCRASAERERETVSAFNDGKLRLCKKIDMYTSSATKLERTLAKIKIEFLPYLDSFYPSGFCYSRTCTMSMTWKLMRNAESQVPPQTTESESAFGQGSQVVLVYKDA